MSDAATRVTDAHFRYVAEHTRGDDDFLRDLKSAAEDAGLPRIWINPAQASFLQVTLKLMGARRVVEVGTLGGYSAIQMARALPGDGLVRTIEIDDAHADFAEEWIARSDVAGRVEVLRGAGADVLPTLEDDWADAAFLDADKSGYPDYLRECLRIVRRGGLIAADNAFAFGQLLDDEPTDGEVGAVRAFNDVMAVESRVHGVIVPLGDGCWISVVE